MDPTTFGRSYRDFMQDKSKVTEWNYMKKVAYDVVRETGGDLGLLRRYVAEFQKSGKYDEFVETISVVSGIKFPDYMFIEKLREVTPEELLKTPCQTEAVLRFYGRVMKRPTCAMVFPLKGMGNWVVHNVYVMDRPGSHRLMISTSGATTPSVIIEDFKTFMEETKHL